MNTLHLVALLLALLGAQASIIRQPDAAPVEPVPAEVEAVEGARKPVPVNVVPQVDFVPKVEQIEVAAPPPKQVQQVEVVAPKEEAVSNEVAAPEVQPVAVEQVEPEGRNAKGDANAPNSLHEFYIPENAAPNGVTVRPNITHSHEHHYVKPALFPWLPSPPAGGPTWNYSNYNQNKFPTFPTSPNNMTYPGFPFLPLLPIPFWKPYGNMNGSKPQFNNYNAHQVGATPGDFYIHERSVLGEDQPQPEQQQPEQQQPSLQLIGHIYILKRPQNGAGAAAAKPAPAADEIFGEGFDGGDEQFANSQLLLQPVVYPVGQANREQEVHPQISEIYRSLHLVPPSVQQRSKAAAPAEDRAVLFAVEIPKPIYRFFKSVVGVFSY